MLLKFYFALINFKSLFPLSQAQKKLCAFFLPTALATAQPRQILRAMGTQVLRKDGRSACKTSSNMNATHEDDRTWHGGRAVMLAGIVLASGCGGHNAPDLAAYQQLLTQTGSVVAGHRDAGTHVTSVSDCAAEHSQYDGRMRSLIEQMKGMSGAMDDCMMSLG